MSVKCIILAKRYLLIVFHLYQPLFEIEDREKDKSLAQGLPVFDWTVSLISCKLSSLQKISSFIFLIILISSLIIKHDAKSAASAFDTVPQC